MRGSPSLRSIAFYPSRQLHHHHHPHPPHHAKLPQHNHHSTRPFSSSLTPSQTLSASRILPYSSPALFNIIADISSYPSFIPYLHSSHITSFSLPDRSHNNKKWPRTASLSVGYGPYTESFTSNVYCAPYTVLEAVAGDAAPTIPESQLRHYGARDHDAPGAPSSELIQSLLTRWTFREFPFKPAPPDGSSPQEGSANAADTHPRTEVGLHIEVRFANPVYAALSQAAAPKVARVIVEAFEKRAREVLGREHEENLIQGGGAKSGNMQH